MTNISTITDNYFSTVSESFTDNLSSTILALAATVPVNSTSPYSNGDHVVVTVEPGTANQATFAGEVSGNSFINCTWTEGNLAVGHAAGKTAVDYDSATHFALAMKGIGIEHGTAGTHKNITATGLTVASQTWSSLVTGWLEAGVTWTYVSATTFTLTGDYTSTYTAGLKLRMVQSATSKYFYVVSSSYSAPTTTVVIAVNTDYTLANAAISSPYYSMIAQPVGFPAALNYTPTLSNLSGGTLNVSNYAIRGRHCKVRIRYTLAGAGVAGAVSLTLPLSAATGINAQSPLGQAELFDASAVIVYLGIVTGGSTVASANVWYIGASSALTALSSTVPMTWATSDTFDLQFEYPIA